MFKQKLIDFAKKIFSHPLVKTPLLAFSILAVAVLIFFTFLHIFSRHGRSFPVPDLSSLTIEQATELAKDKRLRLEITDSVYIVTRKPGTVIEQNPKSGTFVKANRRVFVTTNAVNPILEDMPDLIGLSLRQAKSVLQLQGFKIGSLSFVPDIAVNNVLEQKYKGEEVEPGTKIPKGSEINLVLGKGFYNERTVLPRVIGLTLAEARNLLHDASLNLGRYSFDETIFDKADSLNAMVYSQYPNPTGETSISFGARVDLWLTLNESRIPPEPKPEIEEEEEETDDEFDYSEMEIEEVIE
jgi:beta-lactam-binding protein with PASTA domain